MTTTTASPTAAHRARLRRMVQRLVIEQGYLQHCIEQGIDKATIRLAADYLDDAIEHLNEYLETYGKDEPAPITPTSSNTPDKGYMHPTEGWVSGHLPD